MPRLKYTEAALAQLRALDADAGLAKRAKAVKRALGKMSADLRYPGLSTHQLQSMKCPHDDKLFEAYAENKTPAAYRIFWCYLPPPPDAVLIIAITPHP